MVKERGRGAENFELVSKCLVKAGQRDRDSVGDKCVWEGGTHHFFQACTLME